MRSILPTQTLNTHCVTCRSSVEHGVKGVDFVSSKALFFHLELHNFFIGQKVDAITSRLSKQSDRLTLINTSDTMPSIYFLDSIQGTGICGLRV